MAKQPDKQAPQKPVPYPKNWPQMTAEQKGAWREKNQGIKPTQRAVAPPKTYGAATSKPTPQEPAPEAEGYEEQEQPEQEQPEQEQPDQEQPDQEQPDGGEQLYAGSVMAMVQELDQKELRKVVGRILMVVGEALYNLARKE